MIIFVWKQIDVAIVYYSYYFFYYVNLDISPEKLHIPLMLAVIGLLWKIYNQRKQTKLINIDIRTKETEERIRLQKEQSLILDNEIKAEQLKKLKSENNLSDREPNI